MKPAFILSISQDDLWQRRLSRLLEGSAGSLQLIARCPTLSEAQSAITNRTISLVLISNDLIKHAEFESFLALLNHRRIRWLSVLDAPSARSVQRVTDRTSGLFQLDPDETASRILGQIRAMAGVRSAPPAQPMKTAVPKAAPRKALSRRTPIIVIGASTGGVEALSQLCPQFGADMPPCVIVQHTGQGYGDHLIRLIDDACSARVVGVKDNQPLEPNTIYLAAGLRQHVGIAGGRRLRLSDAPPIHGHRPAIDHLFRSARDIAPRMVAFLMTGMGRDGAEGLLDLRNAGARTYAQDAASSVVFGMPRVAWELGAAQAQLSLATAADTILDACSNIDRMAH